MTIPIVYTTTAICHFHPDSTPPNPMSTLRAKRVFFIALLAALAGIGRADDAVLFEGVNATPLFGEPTPDPLSVVPQAPSSGFAFTKGGFTIAPYGAFWADMIYATQRTNPGAFTLFVFSEDDQGESALTIDARRTRLGADISGPDFGGGSTGGRVEIDFHGDFVTENRATVLLRHAYWEWQDDRTRLLVGQEWDVASPLYPSTLNYAYGYLAGNIGFRRTQFRAERKIQIARSISWSLQGSINQDIVTDFPTEAGIRREASNWPVVEARTAITVARQETGCDPVELGFSGHIGETGFDFLTAGPPPLSLPAEDDARFRTWSFNVDLHVPVTQRLGLQGEFFLGSNLSTFLGGIGQGVCPCLRRPIRSTGGWGEVWFQWTDRVGFHCGYGIDDPNDEDLLVGRVQNQFFFANIVADVTPALTTGLEVSYFETKYLESRNGLIPDDQLGPSAPGEAVTIDWMVKYAF